MHDHQTHSHAHHHHGHGHGVDDNADQRYLIIALAILAGFMLVELIVGLLASSLALISDAGHMLTDAGAIGLSLVAMRLAKRPARGRYTFGFKRAEILSAQANGITLLLLALWFVVEAVLRLIHPPEVDGELVTIVALAGIVVNLVVVWVMGKANRQSLNVEGSFQHILTDLYAFVATAVAGALIWWTGWNRFDALAALLVAVLMARAGYALVRESGRVFLQAAPEGLDPAEISAAMKEVAGMVRVDDLHVWELTSGMPALSAHLQVRADVDCHVTQHAVRDMLAERFGVHHVTVQAEHDHAADAGGNEAPACVFDAGEPTKSAPR
ncbi:MAG TPA: cation diffusion facilitator family transporter [Oleiagrimonas sp.]|nr:cation diffusion facilitator family transporter [Oleiagrimonas sp.]